MPGPSRSQNRLALPAGSVIGSYRIRNVLGEGGFGITYLADHVVIKSRQVALKELLPSTIAMRASTGEVMAKSSELDGDMEWARESFVKEAQLIAACRHSNIIDVFDVFEANGTAYMATSYEKGDNLENWLKNLGRKPTESEVLAIILPLLDGLEFVHARKVLHRDLKPDNIYLCTDGRPVLLDFGAARETVGRKSLPITAICAPGYTPYEQYSEHDRDRLGPWTDLYALGATMYRMIMGTKPIESSARLRHDSYQPVSGILKGKYSPQFLDAIDWALAVLEQDRPQSVADYRKALKGALRPPPSTVRPPPPRPSSPGAAPRASGPRSMGGDATQTARHLQQTGSTGGSGRLGLYIGVISGLIAMGAIGFIYSYFQNQMEELRLKAANGNSTVTTTQGGGTSSPATPVQPVVPYTPPVVPTPPAGDPPGTVPQPKVPKATPPDPPAVRTPPPPDPLEEVRSLARRYFDLGCTENGRTERYDMYADSVYYSDRTMTRAEVKEDQEDYNVHWPNQNYTIISGPLVIRASGGYEASLTFDFTAKNTVVTRSGRRSGTLRFDADKKVTSVTSSEIGTDDSQIDRDAEERAMINFVKLYLEAGDSTPSGSFSQERYFDDENPIYPYFDNAPPSGWSTYQIKADTEKYNAEHPYRDYSIGTDWRAISGLGTNEVLLQGTMKMERGSGLSPISYPIRVKVRMGGKTNLRVGAISMEILGIGKPEDW